MNTNEIVQPTTVMRAGIQNELTRRRIGAEIKRQLPEVARPSDVGRMLGISKQQVNLITDKALYKIYMLMTYDHP